MIDLRSDTVTRPVAAMFHAMTNAPLGYDVMQDDPTGLRLQQKVAERAGKEAGLFFFTGTQSNLAGLMSHCQRGDKYLVWQWLIPISTKADAWRCLAAFSLSRLNTRRTAVCR